MTFWEGFFQLPNIFVMAFLSISLVGILFVINELANRKMRIDKSGITFDRLRDKKGFIIKLAEMRQKKKEKINIQDINNK
jgi:hypothetical protein